jgi:glutamate-5-semialdehyde dehydrogenase
MITDTDPTAQWLHKAATASRTASNILARLPGAARDAALSACAAAIRARSDQIVGANARDVAAFDAGGGTAAFRDRLLLDHARVEAMAKGLDELAALPDPLARTLADWTRPNGLRIRQIPQPLGVIGMIYESRPNVGADAAGICIKSGNAVILRGGSDSNHSARAIHAAMSAGLRSSGLPEGVVQIAPGTDRAYVAAMLAGAGLIDLIIPRGGRSLVERVQHEARVPVLAHAEGLCHTYIHASANHPMARRIIANAKMRRTGVCGATETLLIDAAIAPSLLPSIVADLEALGCLCKGDEQAQALIPGLAPAIEEDFQTEWLAPVLSVAIVGGVDEALAHISRYGSSHTEAIVTQDEAVAQHFLRSVDSAVSMWNASTQFCDGGEFGFGAEIGIATGRIHTRGPVGVEQLTTSRYVVVGTGQIRP